MSQGARRAHRIFRRIRPGVIACVIAIAALLPPATANAAFSRPLLRQISGPFFGGVQPQLEGGIAVDSVDHLWVGGLASGAKPFSLNEFKPASELNTFEQSIEIEGLNPPELNGVSAGLTPPQSLAINAANGAFYTLGEVTRKGSLGSAEVFDGSGNYTGRFSLFTGGQIAVDNSGGPSGGSVYIASGQSSQQISKYNAAGEPVPFSESGKGLPYVSGNHITGFIGGSHPNFDSGEPRFVAVDEKGDIYTSVRVFNLNTKPHEAAVLEYAPSGAFLHAFRGGQTPGLGESSEDGFGGEIKGIAIDPLSGDVLVAVTQYSNNLAPVAGAVDEFDSSGDYLGQITASSSGKALQSAAGLAVDSNGNLYVADFKVGVIAVYEAGHFVPGLRLGEATQRTPSAAVLTGAVTAESGVNPEHAGVTSCRFEYVSEAAFKTNGFADLSSGGEAPCEPPAGSISTDDSFHPVHAAIGGLTPGATYRYRLTATTGGEKGGTASSAALAFTAPHAPAVEAVGVDNLSSTFADLHATINPLGAATNYQFQYLTSAAYAENGESFEGPQAPIDVPANPVPIGSGSATGNSSEAVLQHLAGLEAATSYRFRVIASNAAGIDALEGSFTTLAAVEAGLPDGRRYELVTPADKGSAEDMFGAAETSGRLVNLHDVGLASEAGNEFLFEATAAFGPFPGSPHNSYVFSRTESGWTFKSLSSPGLGVQNIVENSVLSGPGNFSQVALTDRVGSGSSEGGSRTYAFLGPPGGPYSTVHVGRATHTAKPGEIDPEEATIVGASRDLDSLVLSAGTTPESKTHPLCTGMETLDVGSRALCEYSDGEMQPVNVKTNGSLLTRCGAALGSDSHVSFEGSGKAHNAVSSDGSRVFFTAPDPGAANQGPGCWDGGSTNAPQLYVRSAGVTTEISAPQPGVSDPTGQHWARYAGAAEDGSRAYFFSEAELTKDSEGIHDGELYEWRASGIDGCESSNGCLSRVSKGGSGEAAGGVVRVPLVSEDGAIVYFMANGVLAGNQGGDGTFAAAGNCAATGDIGTCNLYRYDATTGTTIYVSRIEKTDWGSQFSSGIGLSEQADWYTTPNDRYLLFGSTRELTGYDTAGCAGFAAPLSQSSTEHCQELYRYDSVTGGLTCVSCNPSGQPPLNHAEFSRSADPTFPGGPVRAMSDNGEEVFFDSVDALVPQDINGTLDVYEWHNGKLSLLSSGTDFAPSFFLGASSSGGDVFIGTHSRLVPQDSDSQGDIYDVRVNGGFAPPSEPGPCEGDACAPALPAPNDSTPASLTYFGPGNERPPVKRKPRRHGKKHKKTNHSSRHHKRPAAGASKGGQR